MPPPQANESLGHTIRTWGCGLVGRAFAYAAQRFNSQHSIKIGCHNNPKDQLSWTESIQRHAVTAVTGEKELMKEEMYQ